VRVGVYERMSPAVICPDALTVVCYGLQFRAENIAVWTGRLQNSRLVKSSYFRRWTVRKTAKVTSSRDPGISNVENNSYVAASSVEK
jgi:hypothetical protein